MNKSSNQSIIMSWKISSKVKKKILDKSMELDNDKRILFILKNLGPQRFMGLEKYCGVSRSTLSKYLKLHLEQKRLEKGVYTTDKGQETRYFITKRGEEKLHEEDIKEGESLFFINELKDNLEKIMDLIDFYKEIGVDDTIISPIVNIVLKIGDKFFELSQNRDLYLTLFYIINYNSILTPDYKLNLIQFCEVYDIDEVEIRYFIRKIMSKDLGFFMFVRGNDVFFFHEKDLLGTMTLRLVKDHLIEEIIHPYVVEEEKEMYDLDKEAEKITEHIKAMGLIWEAVKEQFEILIKKLIIKTAVDMGISRTTLTDLVIQSEKISKSPEFKKSLINIIEGSDKYEDLNIIEVYDSEEELKEGEMKKLDEILGRVEGKGFCPNCGKIILKTDFLNRCSKCKQGFNPKKLLKSIDAANEASMRFKQEREQEELLTTCPNLDCEAMIGVDWEECPVCHTEIKK